MYHVPCAITCHYMPECLIVAAELSPANDNCSNGPSRTATPVEQRQLSPSSTAANELTELKPVVSDLSNYSQQYAVPVTTTPGGC